MRSKDLRPAYSTRLDVNQGLDVSNSVVVTEVHLTTALLRKLNHSRSCYDVNSKKWYYYYDDNCLFV